VVGEVRFNVSETSPANSNPAIGFGQWPRLDAAAMGAAFDGATEKPGLFQHLHVLGRSREGHVEWPRQFAHAVLTVSQLTQHRATGRIGERMEHAIQGGCIIFNH